MSIKSEKVHRVIFSTRKLSHLHKMLMNLTTAGVENKSFEIILFQQP